MRLRFILASCFAFSSAFSIVFSGVFNAAYAWDLNDVSILLPLPKDLKTETLLRAETQGDGGPLITVDSFSLVPPLAFSRDRNEELKSLRAVGFRIDPCFPGDTPGACRPQVRIVWQPLIEERGGVETLDAAVHTFYDLTSTEFASLLQEMKPLKINAASSQPLSVHPLAKRQGLSGAYVTQLHKTLLKYIGAKRLTRLTFMLVRGNSIIWAFAGFDLHAGVKPVPMMIARIEDQQFSHQQTFVNSSINNLDFQRSNIAPAPFGADVFNLLLKDSTLIESARDEAEIVSSFKAIDRIENPRIHSPANVDCVSCHVAQGARSFAETAFPALQAKAREEVQPFNSTFQLGNLSPVRKHTRNLRAFGYFGKDPAISQRVINESAEVAEALTK